MSTFNTFGAKSQEFGGGKMVWHAIDGKYPGGGSVSNLSSFTEGQVIPAGSMCVFDHAKHTCKIVKATDIKTSSNSGGTVKPEDVNGLTENDIWYEKGTTYATATIVYAGLIYSDRLAEAIPAEVWANLSAIKQLKEK